MKQTMIKKPKPRRTKRSKKVNEAPKHPQDEASWIESEVKKFDKPRKFETRRLKLDNNVKVLVLGDLQIPFQDNPSLSAIGRFAADYMPDLEIYNGDVLDAYSISSFDRNPSRLFNLQRELDMTYRWLRSRVTANPDARRIYIGGNHE